MLGVSPATKIYLGAAAVDMRKGFDGLYGLVRDQLGQDPLSGHLFLFTNRDRTRLKALVWEGSGLWICAKRLEKGRFAWPVVTGGGTKCHAAGGRVSDAVERSGSETGAATAGLVPAPELVLVLCSRLVRASDIRSSRNLAYHYARLWATGRAIREF